MGKTDRFRECWNNVVVRMFPVIGDRVYECLSEPGTRGGMHG